MSAEEFDEFDEDDAWYSDDPEEKEKEPFRSKINAFVPIAALVIAASFFLPTTIGGRITLSSGQSIEFGQGANIAVACSGSTDLTVSPQSSFVNASGGGGTHYLKSIAVSNIPSTCDGVDFQLSIYNNSSSSPLSIFNSTSTQATVWNSPDGFVIGASTNAATIQSGSGSFVLSFDTPTATSANSVKITLQSKLHSSCFVNSSIQCGFEVVQASFAKGVGISNSYDGSYVYVQDESGAIYKSVDGGKNFSVSLADTGARAISNVSSSQSGQYVVAANTISGGGVYYSSNYGVSWTELFPSSASTDKSFQDARISEDGQHIIATLTGGQSGKIFYSHNSGQEWSFASVRMHASSSGSSRNFGQINRDGTVMATMMQNGRFNRSIDSGVTWDTQTAQSGNWTVFMSGDGDFMGSITLNTSIWSTSDGKSATPTWVNKVGSGNPSNVYVCRADPNRLAYTGGNGSAAAPLYLSVDKGKNWTLQTSLGTGQWQGISFNGDCSRMYLLAYNNKLYISNG